MLKTLQNIALYSSVFAAKKSILVKVFSQTEIKWKESNPEGSWSDRTPLLIGAKKAAPFHLPW